MLIICKVRLLDQNYRRFCSNKIEVDKFILDFKSLLYDYTYNLVNNYDGIIDKNIS